MRFFSLLLISTLFTTLHGMKRSGNGRFFINRKSHPINKKEKAIIQSPFPQATQLLFQLLLSDLDEDTLMKELTVCLQQHPGINTYNENIQKRPLDLAIIKQQKQVVRLLIQNGAAINDNALYRTFDQVIFFDDFSMLNILLDFGLRFNVLHLNNALTRYHPDNALHYIQLLDLGIKNLVSLKHPEFWSIVATVPKNFPEENLSQFLEQLINRNIDNFVDSSHQPKTISYCTQQSPIVQKYLVPLLTKHILKSYSWNTDTSLTTLSSFINQLTFNLANATSVDTVLKKYLKKQWGKLLLLLAQRKQSLPALLPKDIVMVIVSMLVTLTMDTVKTASQQ
jgi:hypothetical protein